MVVRLRWMYEALWWWDECSIFFKKKKIGLKKLFLDLVVNVRLWLDDKMTKGRYTLTNEFSGKKTTLVRGEWESSMGVVVRGSLSTCALKDSCIGDHVGEIWPWLLEKCLESVSRKEGSMWVDFGWLWNSVGMICGWKYDMEFSSFVANNENKLSISTKS